jgi:type II secretory pathway pseudopilin PulG
VGVVGVVAVVPFSMAVATISISPLSGTVFDVAKSEMTVPPGARSGTLSHAETNMVGRRTIDARPTRPIQANGIDCASIEKPKDSNFMGLRGVRDRDSERGYAMAALLVTLAIMTILLSIAMPVWRHEAQREKEAELVFRGEQYARAIALFKFKNANIPNAVPPSIDFLVQNRFLRKKYKDPMTKDGEFVVIGGGSNQPGMTSPGQTLPGQTRPEQAPPGATPPRGRSNTPVQPGVQPNVPSLGMIGVRSKSEETSIRTYRGATRYDQWQFTFNIAPRPGGAMPMANSPDGRGGNPNVGPDFPPGGGRGPGRGGPGGGRGPGVGPGGFPPVQGPGGGNRGVNPGGRGRGF